MTGQQRPPSASRLARLLGFLESDPRNLRLIADAASAAFDEQSFAQAYELLARYAALEPLPPELLNLKGLVALAEGKFAEAASAFAGLRAEADNPVLRFNLAWAKANMGAYREAIGLLDDEALAAAPRAPALKIHAMHHLMLYGEALAEGERLAKRYPGDEALMGALATLALDAERADLALVYGRQATGNTEGQAALGFLALGENKDRDALALFDRAIAAQPGNPRAWVGKGLGLLASGNAKDGVDAIDRGAELFHDHLGSWIASGWAHFVNGQNDKARASFERAMAIDPNFSECHGGLAVLDVIAGDFEKAKRESEIALRLDRNSLGGALSASMLLDKSGNAKAAQRVRDIAFSAPIGPNGQTLAQALLAFSRKPQR
jgi:tetratricopeptide (TPR) repeat protein